MLDRRDVWGSFSFCQLFPFAKEKVATWQGCRVISSRHKAVKLEIESAEIPLPKGYLQAANSENFLI
jgi:hypothetical protein